MSKLPRDLALCYPNPDCPDKRKCARYGHMTARSAMHAMPHRIEGRPCGWFVQKDEEVKR